jgi:hypothetical protein
MTRKPDRLSLLLIALIVLIGAVAALILTDTVILNQDRAPSVPAANAVPPVGSTVTIYDDAGDPALIFQTSNFQTADQPLASLNILRHWVTVTITNRTSAPVHISPNTMLGIIDSWGAYQGLAVVDDNDGLLSSASFDLAAAESRTLRLRVELPTTARPDLLVFDRASHFAVLASFNESIAGVGQTTATAAIPTQFTSWLAPQAGELTVNSLDAAAEHTDRGFRLWDEDTQTAQVTLTFTNIQDGRYFWSPDWVAVVDQLGRMYVAYPGPVNAGMATPGATGSIAQNLVPAHSTVRLTLHYDVPLGTKLAYVLINAGRAEYVIAAQSAGDSNLAYSNDQIAMLNLASGSCTSYADWSNRAHETLSRLDQVLSSDLSTMTAKDLRAAAQSLRVDGSGLFSGDTFEQGGFSESSWLQQVMAQTADKLDEAAAQLETNPALTPSIDPTTVDDLVAMRDQFATRLTTLDGFVSTGCGDLFG